MPAAKIVNAFRRAMHCAKEGCEADGDRTLRCRLRTIEVTELIPERPLLKV